MPRVRLTREDVREIRRLNREEGWGYQRLANRYGVEKPTIQQVCTGKTWKDVKDAA